MRQWSQTNRKVMSGHACFTPRQSQEVTSASYVQALWRPVLGWSQWESWEWWWLGQIHSLKWSDWTGKGGKRATLAAQPSLRTCVRQGNVPQDSIFLTWLHQFLCLPFDILTHSSCGLCGCGLCICAPKPGLCYSSPLCSRRDCSSGNKGARGLQNTQVEKCLCLREAGGLTSSKLAESVLWTG